MKKHNNQKHPFFKAPHQVKGPYVKQPSQDAKAIQSLAKLPSHQGAELSNSKTLQLLLLLVLTQVVAEQNAETLLIELAMQEAKAKQDGEAAAESEEDLEFTPRFK